MAAVLSLKLLQVGRSQIRMAGKGIASALGQFAGAHLADQHHRVGIADHALFLPFHLQPGRIAHDQIKAAALEQIGKFQIPMQGADAIAHRLHLAQALELLPQLLHIHKTMTIAEIHRQLLGLGIGK